MHHNLEILENTHRQFEIAVHEAELVLPESSDNSVDLLSACLNPITTTAKMHNNVEQTISSKQTNSTTRSDIESDSGIESINSDLQRQQFQASPLYSPIGMCGKTFTSPSPSSSNHINDNSNNKKESNTFDLSLIHI